MDELKDEAFIGYKECFIFQQMNDNFLKEAGIAPRYVCRVDEPPAIASLVRAGLGDCPLRMSQRHFLLMNKCGKCFFFARKK
ncbi:LysR family transcriptional regulator substrate-binding protein [Paenibacillus lautus]|uniref:LysR family transcriptional regulator substrate-binding protein n=1 Tax=Paenibacillus lautus TaxID=1401 RepID=UPI0027958842|nr:LysR family transcriptional regulator substrate-binding protein [Paenibacillus lautus]